MISAKPRQENPVTIQHMHEAAGGASGRRILDLYDRGIDGCLKRDAAEVREVLLELMAALNFDYEEAATGFFRIYELSLRHVKGRRFGVPLHILRRLRAVWTEPYRAATRQS